MTIEKLLAELPILSAIIMAFVAFLKKLGVAGNWLTASSFVSGLVIGVAYRYAAEPMVDFAGWFWAIMFGLLAGGVAAGVYMAGQGIVGTDDSGKAAALKADNVQTKKIITAIDAGPEKTTPS